MFKEKKYFIIFFTIILSTIFGQETIESKEVIVEKLDEEIIADSLNISTSDNIDTLANDLVLKDNNKLYNGFNIGLAPSFGILSGETFTGIPIGGIAVITTPYGFKLGPLNYNISIAFGSYLGDFEGTSFDPIILGVGGNLTLLDFIFSEGHIGKIGDGFGLRGFGGISLERILKRGLNLPFNVLLGSEVFISNDMTGSGNPSGWLSLGVRLDYGF